ncbi:MAG: hypothetical protein MUD08_09985 [Cytophagales bacterium]|nr:hypothetical protein [Cytophagales bacterium]
MQAQAQAAPPPQEYYQGKYATVTFLPANETAIFRIHGAFIPMTDYQAALDKLSELVQQDKVQKLVVDAPKLQDGLRKIGREHPDTGIDRLDLAYCRTLDEAVED